MKYVNIALKTYELFMLMTWSGDQKRGMTMLVACDAMHLTLIGTLLL